MPMPLNIDDMRQANTIIWSIIAYMAVLFNIYTDIIYGFHCKLGETAVCCFFPLLIVKDVQIIKSFDHIFCQSLIECYCGCLCFVHFDFALLCRNYLWEYFLPVNFPILLILKQTLCTKWTGSRLITSEQFETIN